MERYFSFIFILYVAGLWFAEDADAHGRLLKPCQRASLFRCYDKQGFAVNTNDMSLFCGGTQKQWGVNGGKCGICGDPYDETRTHEVGGKFAKGFITETYRQGQEISVIVELTAAHKGNFFFKICKQTDESIEVTQECLDKSPLKVVQNGELKESYKVTQTSKGKIPITLKLPDDVTCDHCVFQWWYTTGNSWGRFPGEKGCLGCGPQETFVNCADVKILPNDGGSEPVTKAPTAQPITNRPQTMRPITRHPSTANPWMTPSPSTKRTTTTPRSITRAPPNPGGIVTSCYGGQYLSCQAAGVFAGNRGYDDWCDQYCKANSPNCNPRYCSCTCKPRQCTVKAMYKFLLGSEVCSFLGQFSPNSPCTAHFCDCF